MNEKQIMNGNAARERILAGVSEIYDAVKCTLGPLGRNVIIRRAALAPSHITKDGATVAKDIVLPDQLMDIGAQVVKEVALKTADVAGDGTTTATVLAANIIRRGIHEVNNGANAVRVKRGIELASKIALDHVIKSARHIGTDADEIMRVATVSANNDEAIGKIIMDGMSKISLDGVITIDASKTSDTHIEIVEGMRIDRGYISPYFITDPEKQNVVLNDVYVLCANMRIDNMKEIVHILEGVTKSNKSIVIFAEDVEGDALSAIILNKINGRIRAAAVKTPYYGELRAELLEDIATVVGGNVVSPDMGIQLDKAVLGFASKIIITRDNTTIIGGAGKAERIGERASKVRAQIETCMSDSEKEVHKQRLAKLVGGVAVIYVGAATETEMKEKYDRVDDALKATRAAIAEGVVPGGGIAYANAARAVFKAYSELAAAGENADMLSGIKAVHAALVAPFEIIMSNAGISCDVVRSKMEEVSDCDYGYDAKSGKYGNMFELGIIDPVKVARVAIETASSIACTFITTECVIAPQQAPK